MGTTLTTAFYLPFSTRESDRSRSERALIQDLLCYDTVLILTDHMSAVGMVAAIMGTSALETALESGAIRFVNDRNILSWTGRTRSGGISPFLHLRAQPTPDNPSAFTEQPLSRLALFSAKGFGLDDSNSVNISRKAERTAIDFTEPLPIAEPRIGHSGGLELASEALDKIRTYKSIVQHLDNYPLTLGDLLRLERDLHDSTRSPLNTNKIRVVKTSLVTGWDSVNQTLQMSRKQLGLLNLYLSDHFLAVHAAAAPDSTLHTENLVERILTARLAEIRAAAGQEVEDVLRMAKVPMPSLLGGSEFPYLELLKIRDSAAAKAFRQIVSVRDADPDQDLVQAYYSGLKSSFGARTAVRFIRFLTTSVAGLEPILGAILSATDAFLLDRLLGRRDARYFIDEQLMRMIPTKK
jgi:hypothetical protein